MPRTLSLLILAALATAAFAADPVPQTQPSIDLSRLAASFASDDFQAREAAQKQLDAIGWQNLSALRQQAAAATDPEVKARFSARIEVIEDQFATTPPLLSLNAKDASLKELCAGFSVWSPIKFESYSGPARYTFKATDVTFASLLNQLHAQHPIQIVSVQKNLLLQPALKPGCLTFTPQALIVWQESPYCAATPAESVYYLQSHILIDPRVKIAGCTMQFHDAKDELGNALTIDESPHSGIYPAPFIEHSIKVTVPAKGGTKIASAKGTMTLTIAVREEHRVIEDPAKHLNEAIKLGRGSFTLTKFDAKENEIQFDLSRGATFDQARDAAALGAVPSAAELLIGGRLLDANDEELMQLDCVGGGMSSDNSPVAKLPVRVELSVPTKTAKIVIPLELRDVPLK